MKTEAYLVDAPFQSAFAARATPVHLALIAGLAGAPAPAPDAAFTYVDIGCGEATTLILCAAAYPQARFIGIEINDAHIAGARDLIAAGGVENCEIIKADFATLDPGMCGAADFIVCAGLYAWLDAARREAFWRFAEQIASARCVLALDYAAQPGSAGADALYRIMRAVSTTPPSGSSADRLVESRARMLDLQQAGARFFSAYPSAAARLEDMRTRDPDSEAHEVFNLTEGAVWSDDVRRLAGKSGFSFAGPATLVLHRDELSLPSGAAPLAGDLWSAQGQLVRDVFRNAAHRADVFVTGKVDRADWTGVAEMYCAPALRTSQLPHAIDIKQTWRAAQRAVEAKPAARLGDLLGACSGEREAFLDVLALGLVQPVVAPWQAAPTPSSPVRVTPGLNALLLEADLLSLAPRPLVSPVTGSQLAMPPGDRLALLALAGVSAAEIARRFEQAGMTRPWRDLSDAAFAEKLQEQADALLRHSGAVLARLGIISAE